MEEPITIVTVSHNNYHYLKFMVNQIERIMGSNSYQLLVMDNQSTETKTKNYLHELDQVMDAIVLYNQTNYGPRINHMNHQEIYKSLPERYLMTDPDILVSPQLPPNFYEIMCRISEQYGAEKVGFALDISEPNLLYDMPDYFMGKSIVVWESQFWQHPIEPLWESGDIVDTPIPLYRAEIDTTFCLVNKRYENSGVHIRMGGPKFTAKHLPWYRRNPVFTDQDILYDMAREQGADSTMAQHILRGL